MPSSRRRFLEAALLLGGAAIADDKRPRVSFSTDQSENDTRGQSFDPWLEINGANLRHNVEQVTARVSGRPILAVIKNNGYGMGVTEAARLLTPLPAIHGFAVVKLHEAITLRDAGITKPILLMGPFDDADLAEIAARDIMPMVYTPIGDALDRQSAKRQRPIAVHICVDTGLGRVGVPHAQAAALVRDLAARQSVWIDGVMMTFSEDPELDKEQIRRFQTLCDGLESGKIPLGRRHTASSFGLFQHPSAFFDMVRPGMALYGVYSEQEFRTTGVLDLRPAMALRARVAYVKMLKAGESAGYNRTYIATDDVWVATLPVGHADGWPRAAAKSARVRINDQLYPVIASVSASHTIVEIGPEPRVKIGDVATLWDWQSGSRPEDVSAACGASVYDLTMHLSPLLPKRVS
jgi:alanine racemase